MPRSAVALIRLAAPHVRPDVDAELLQSFIASQKEDAFAELVRRHGPMVLATCLRVLSNTHDAEDAFQAVFIILARKANTIRGTNLAGWLYGVAVRTARGVRIMRDRRQKHSRNRGPEAKKPETGIREEHGEEVAPDSSLLLAEQAAIIDEEIAKLPEYHRDAVVLCELRGLPRKQAAEELGIPEGTLSSRLATAKRKLAAGLATRGITGAAVLSLALTPVTVSATLQHSTALAVRGVANSIANTAAATVLKGMLFDQLKRAILAAGVLLTGVCGGLAMTGVPGGNAPTSTTRPAEELAEKLVKQLGSEDFAARESASKELRILGSKAESALKAGLASEDAEIRSRCAKLLSEIRKDVLDNFAKSFNSKAERLPDHPIWTRFKTAAGDTPASRDLFARIIKNNDWLRRLDVAESGPKAAAQQYREAMLDVGRIVRANSSVGFEIFMWPCDPADQTAYLLFLGGYPGVQVAEDVEGKDTFRDFDQGEWQLLTARGLRLGLQGKEVSPGAKNRYDETAALASGSDHVFGKLLAGFLTRRSEQTLVFYGMTRAVKYHASEVLPVARSIAADKARPTVTRATALIAVAQFGTTTDLPLFEALFDESGIVISREPSVPPGAKPPPTMTAQVRDTTIALALLLCNEDPSRYGFVNAEKRFKQDNGRPVIGDYESIHFSFPDEKSRTAAHAKAKAFLAKQKIEPKKEESAPSLAPEKFVEQLGDNDFATREAAQKQLKELGSKARSALEAGLKSQNPEIAKRCRELLDHLTRTEFDARHWPRFAKVIGDDKGSRALFERIRSSSRNIQLLNAIVADPKSASKLYDDRWLELNKASRTHTGVGSYTLAPAQLADIVGWMYLGTFPGAEGAFHTSYSLDFLPFMPISKSSDASLSSAFKDKTVALALRRLIGKWTAARIDYSGRGYGFELALQLDIKEVLPAARETLTTKVKNDPYPGNTSRNIAFAMLVIGKLGSKDDLPLLEKFAGSNDVCAVCLNDPPAEPGQPTTHLLRPPKDGQDATGQLRDVSAAMRLHMLGEDPDTFGFYWRRPDKTDRKSVRVEDRFQMYSIGFIRKTDRAAAHKKAKEWFDKHKVEPKKEEPKPAPVAAKLVEQLASVDFATRESASQELRKLGLKAETALKVGLQSDDPEIRARSAKILTEIRKDVLDTLVKGFEPTGTVEPDHPIWKRYKSIAGNDGPARRLFAEIIRDPHRLQILDGVEAKPNKVRELYEQHVAEINSNIQKGHVRHQQVMRHFQPNNLGRVLLPGETPPPPNAFKRVIWLGGSRFIDPDDPTPKPADLAVTFYLGTFPATSKALPFAEWENWSVLSFPEREVLFANAMSQGLDTPYRQTPANATIAPAFRKLFTAWLAERQNPGPLCVGLSLAQRSEITEALPTARAVLANAKNPVKLRAGAVPMIAAHGDAKDESLIAPLLGDTTVIFNGKYGPAQKESQTQVRDVALVAILALRGKDPGEFGYPGLALPRVGPLRKLAGGWEYLGFSDDASRTAAHKKAREWLDQQKK